MALLNGPENQVVAPVAVQHAERRLLPVHIQTHVQHAKPPCPGHGSDREHLALKRIPSLSDSEACYIVSVNDVSAASAEEGLALAPLRCGRRVRERHG